MFHSICMIFELLYLKEQITDDSTICLEDLEDAFYDLQDLLNTKLDTNSCLTFEDAIEELIEDYDYLFNLTEDEISFDEEQDSDDIYEDICEILGEKMSIYDEDIQEYIQNIIIYDALKLPIPLEDTKDLFTLNKSITIAFYILASQEAKGENTDLIIDLIKRLEKKLKAKIKNADNKTLTKLKMCFAHYNNMYLSDSITPNINASWHILLLNTEKEINESLFYERLEHLCSLEDEIEYSEEMEELENISTEACFIADEVVLFFNFYILYLNNFIKDCNGNIKKELLEKRNLLLTLGILDETEDYFLKHETLDTLTPTPIKKEWLTPEHFNFLVSNFEEILENIKQKDENIASIPFIIINILLLKCYLDLSINEQTKKELLNKIMDSKYYKNQEYQIYTNYIDDIIFKQNFLSRIRKKGESNK